MKTAHLYAAAALCGLALSLAVSANAQSRPGHATIVHIRGEARYSPDGDMSHAHALTVGQTLDAGAVIQTAADSVVDIALGNKNFLHIGQASDKVAPSVGNSSFGLPSFHSSFNVATVPNVIRLYADTVLAVNKLLTSNTGVDALTDTELDLRQGTIFGNVKKLSSASKFVVKMPNAAAAVRGTTFVLSANGDIIVTDGSCVISAIINGQTVTQVVDAGEKFVPATGQVVKLTPDQIATVEQTAVQVVTVVEGTTSIVSDETTVYVSPTTGSH